MHTRHDLWVPLIHMVKYNEDGCKYKEELEGTLIILNIIYDEYSIK